MSLLKKRKVKQNKSSNGDPIQALQLVKGAGGNAVVASGSLSEAFEGNVIRLFAPSGNVRVRIGNDDSPASDADATDIAIIEGLPEYFSVDAGDKLWVSGGDVEVTNFETKE